MDEAVKRFKGRTVVPYSCVVVFVCLLGGIGSQGEVWRTWWFEFVWVVVGMVEFSNLQRKQLLRSAKQRGVVIQVDALTVLGEIYEEMFMDRFSTFVERVFACLHRDDAGATIVTEENARNVHKALQRELERERGSIGRVFTVIDAFEMPVPTFDRKTKLFRTKQVTDEKFAGTAASKTYMYRCRFELLYQRTLRDARFTLSSSAIGKKNMSLSEIESLHGQPGTRLLFGYLSQLEEGVWYLEDLHGTIELDLKVWKGFDVLSNRFLGKVVNRGGAGCWFVSLMCVVVTGCAIYSRSSH